MATEDIVGKGRVRVIRTILVEGPAKAVRNQLDRRSYLTLDNQHLFGVGVVGITKELRREIHYLDASEAHLDITVSRSDN